MSKRRKVRTDRAAAALGILILLIAVLVSCARSCSDDGGDKKQNIKNKKAAVTHDTTEVTTEEVTTAPLVTVPHNDNELIEGLPTCSACAVYSVDYDTMLYECYIDKQIAPASLTKLLTSCTALQYADSDDVFTVGSEQWLVPENSSLALLTEGQELTLHDLMCGMLLASGNDAAYTTAVGVARQYKDAPYLSDDEAVSVFCGFMNDYAASIGMTGSSFVSPDGWDNDSQYSTVHDLIKLAAHVLTVPELREIVGTYCYSTNFVTGDAAEWTNSNKLLDSDGLYFCPTAIGMKTGSTANAGSNLISAFEENGKTYIIVVAGCTSDDERYELTLGLHDRFITQ